MPTQTWEGGSERTSHVSLKTLTFNFLSFISCPTNRYNRFMGHDPSIIVTKSTSYFINCHSKKTHIITL